MRFLILHPFLVLGAILVVLALQPALKERSWARFLIALALSALVVVLPLLVFGLSAFLVPEWKGGCRYGWLDCFHMGKLALTPLVLVATSALYAVEVLRVEDRSQAWILRAILLGALVSVVCFVFGLVTVEPRMEMRRWLLVPFYVAVWYWARAVQLIRAAHPKFLDGVKDICFSIPFWLGSWIWSRWVYDTLPETPPSCFVVTAASQGHRRFVGPFVEVVHRDRRQSANAQLITLWSFEAVWRTHAPLSHVTFRRLYNRVGPAIAQQVTSPWIADAVYLALKPAELFARLILTITAIKPKGTLARPSLLRIS